MLPIAADDEVPALEVLRAAGAPAGVGGSGRGAPASSGRSANCRTARFVEIACQTDIVGVVAHDRRALGRGGRRHVGAVAAPRRGGPRGLGTASRRERPEAARLALDRGERLLGGRGAAGAGRPRPGRPPRPARSGPPSARARNAATVRRYSLELVQPAVLAALDDRATRRAGPAPAARGQRAARGGPAGRRRRRRRGRAGSGRSWAVSEAAALTESRPGGRAAGGRRASSARRAARRSAPGSAGGRGGTSGGSGGTDRPAPTSRRRRRRVARPRRRGSPRSPPIEWPEIAPTVTSGRAISASNAASASAPNSPALTGSVSAGFAPWPRTSTVRQWKPAAWRNWAIGSVRSRADSQPWTRATPGPGRAVAGRDEPGRQASSSRATARSTPRTAGRGRPGRSTAAAAREAGPAAVDEREAVGERERRGGDRGGDARPGGVVARVKGTARPARLSSVADAASDARSRGDTLGAVAKRDPHVVLGVEPTALADPDQGGLAAARPAASPDLTGDDPEASRVATRQMAEINEAYAAMTRAADAAASGGQPPTAGGGAGTTSERRRARVAAARRGRARRGRSPAGSTPRARSGRATRRSAPADRRRPAADAAARPLPAASRRSGPLDVRAARAAAGQRPDRARSSATASATSAGRRRRPRRRPGTAS